MAEGESAARESVAIAIGLTKNSTYQGETFHPFNRMDLFEAFTERVSESGVSLKNTPKVKYLDREHFE